MATPIPSHTSSKIRATSQPAGERIPARPGSGNSIETGRGSPGGIYGVIGGSRTPMKAGGNGNGTHLGNGTATRANSFSAAEMRLPKNASLSRTLSSHQEEHFARSRSASPFPTFSPASSPSASSPAINASAAKPHAPERSASPPRPFSRSRSQSLAIGVAGMSGLDNRGGAFAREYDPSPWKAEPVEESNMSPFTRGMPYLGGLPGGAELSKFRAAHGGPTRGFSLGAWGTSAPEYPSANPKAAGATGHAALAAGTNSRQQAYSTIIGGFESVNPPQAGAKSGTSSRRHSVSIVGGPQGRRDIFADLGMTSPTRGLGPLGFSDEELLPERLGNALSLEIDEHRKRGVEIEVGKEGARGRDIPRPSPATATAHFDPLGEDSRIRNFPQTIGGLDHFASSPRGRSSGVEDKQGERAASRDSKDSSSRSRYHLETPSSVRPIGTAPTGNLRGINISSSPPQRGRDIEVRRNDILGPIGSPPGPTGPLDPRMYQQHVYGGRQMGDVNAYSGPLPPSMGPNSPLNQTFPRPNSFGYGQRPPLPPMGAGGFGPGMGPMMAPNGPPGTYGMSPQQPYSPNAPTNYSYFSGPPAPSSPTQPHSPSFSQLTLSDLGKGTPLNSLPPNTPLYIVAFKADRRDVYYCPDPTLLISNGDRVIVEADRGSDLGAVIYDQLTPMDVREWQEKQATAALLSGANQHQPPGMAAMAGATQGSNAPRAGGSGELAGADLATLLAGVGAQVDPSVGLGAQGRGPLAKEIMPKRIFTKSAQGPEEQARMMEKMKDEYEAMMICREKVAQRGLPMQIVDAEYQWDRRKLTFYFKADKRIDFRDLTKENFRVFKSRIWMSMVPKDDPRGQ
ncbi:hypothetical protein BD324DRAFT_649896 [Kockovaella imperatae]|uniref:PSP1 C-terminal domain-containing protein n=1 Tax=Kockovaella imperatae TaxID=4999 RepID=A0A1Y1UKN6_9TREE|nr:hypothetical protein BD324DRAFT_649896 [Kockovaella imperatae]ORX38532.1 hypothetical protein BD324DRAFT_649896 [Kockovaella imperatae]